MGRNVSTNDAGKVGLPGILTVAQGGTGANTVVAAVAALKMVPTSEKGAASGLALLDSSGKVNMTNLITDTANGLATLTSGQVSAGVIPSSVTVGATVSGPKTVYTNTSNTYTITNYDSATTYTLTSSLGSVSRNGATITFNPTSAGSNGFSINGAAVNVTVSAPTVNQPSITSPTSGATGQGSSMSFTSAAFAVSGATDTHQSSDWQIATDAAFTNIVASVTASASNLTSWTASGLTANTTYYVRCRHKGTTLGYGAWSAVVSFSTKTSFFVSVQQAQLLASDRADSDLFGSSIALSGDGNTCAVGANSADPSGISNAGAAYIFTRSGSTWTQQTKLIASDKAINDYFGYSVALSSDGNTCAVGANSADPSGITDAGAAYIFTRSGVNWTQQAKLTASDGANYDYFGFSIALSSDGNTCAVGAYANDPSGITDAGAAYIFTRSGVNWSQQAQLLASDKAANDYFGYSVALSSDGNTCAVGAYANDPSGISNAGAAYIFTRSGSTWTQQTKLIASDRADSDLFGSSIALSGDGNTCAVGAYANDPSGINAAGAAYIFTRSGTTWSQQAQLLASDRADSDYFGFSIALSSDGNTCAVGARANDPSGITDAGAAYIFTRSGTVWTQQAKLTASDKAASDYFGCSIALSSDGTACAIGAYRANPSTISDAGAAYIFA